MIRLSELRDKPVRSEDGRRLGRVHEVHCRDGQVIALMCGPGSFIERWTARPKGRRIAWDKVRRVEKDSVIVALP